MKQKELKEGIDALVEGDERTFEKTVSELLIEETRELTLNEAEATVRQSGSIRGAGESIASGARSAGANFNQWKSEYFGGAGLGRGWWEEIFGARTPSEVGLLAGVGVGAVIAAGGVFYATRSLLRNRRVRKYIEENYPEYQNHLSRAAENLENANTEEELDRAFDEFIRLAQKIRRQAQEDNEDVVADEIQDEIENMRQQYWETEQEVQEAKRIIQNHLGNIKNRVESIESSEDVRTIMSELGEAKNEIKNSRISRSIKERAIARIEGWEQRIGEMLSESTSKRRKNQRLLKEEDTKNFKHIETISSGDKGRSGVIYWDYNKKKYLIQLYDGEDHKKNRHKEEEGEAYSTVAKWIKDGK